MEIRENALGTIWRREYITKNKQKKKKKKKAKQNKTIQNFKADDEFYSKYDVGNGYSLYNVSHIFHPVMIMKLTIALMCDGQLITTIWCSCKALYAKCFS